MDPTTREQRSRPARRGSSPDRYSLVGLTVSKKAMGGSELVANTGPDSNIRDRSSAGRRFWCVAVSIPRPASRSGSRNERAFDGDGLAPLRHDDSSRASILEALEHLHIGRSTGVVTLRASKGQTAAGWNLSGGKIGR